LLSDSILLSKNFFAKKIKIFAKKLENIFSYSLH